jgi:hypothetical protein
MLVGVCVCVSVWRVCVCVCVYSQAEKKYWTREYQDIEHEDLRILDGTEGQRNIVQKR